MVYLALVILLILVVVLLLKLRVRFEVSQQRRVLFVGLGRSGPEFDFVNQVTHVKLLGFTVRSMPRVKREKDTRPPLQRERARRIDELEKEHAEEQAKLKLADRGKPSPPSPRAEAFDLLREHGRTVWSFVRGIWRDVIVEELDGHIHAGFDSPHLTGQAYGYYHAVMGAVPALAGRFSFLPVWTGRSFSGNLRVTVALPLYLLVYRTSRLVVQLPVRRIFRVLKRLKKGVRYGAE